MGLTPDQTRQLQVNIERVEKSGFEYGEVRLIYKKGHWRHVYFLVSECLVDPTKGGMLKDDSL